MLCLEQEGMGYREQVSLGRDKFVLQQDHPSATVLSRRPEANGFIRADEASLLFRDVSEGLRLHLEAIQPLRAMRSDKGFEIRWSALAARDVERMFELVRSMARADRP
jgi:hypothetical protein